MKMITIFLQKVNELFKGATSKFTHLEKFSLIVFKLVVCNP